MRRRQLTWAKRRLPPALWCVLLALLPWWLGLPLLLAAAAALPLLRWAAEHAPWLRQSLRWGLPGVLFAVQRALGGEAFAWAMALLGALVGYTLLAALESWLDQPLRAASAAPVSSPEWPQLALAPVGPRAEIIELQSPRWLAADAELADPCGGSVTYRAPHYRFADGTRVEDVAASAAFSADGRWFVARLPADRGVVLCDRQRNRQHRLRGWQLCGWYRGQPWLVRREGDMPMALAAVLGRDDAS